MSHIQKPHSLRQTSPRRVAMVMAAGLSASLPSGATAQDADEIILLPTLTVETAETPTVQAVKPTARTKTTPTVATPAPAATPTAPVQAAAAPQTQAPVAGQAGLSPYADPQAGYRATTSANSMLRQPLAETARTVNAVTREVLNDKNATSVRELARTTPGLSLGTGEGGNAFGDVLYIRGFKATNDTYIDGVRDAGAAIRETFMTEQVEITKGPSGSIAGRGTTGGAVNIVTKAAQAGDFVESATTFGTDGLVRQTLDWNETWDDRLSTRVNLMGQTGDVAGRDGVYDDRTGASVAATYKATDDLTVDVSAYHLDMKQQSDWGVPWINGGPATETMGVDPSTWYGIADRDFQDGTQDILTLGLTYDMGAVTLTNKTRIGKTSVGYIASVPSSYDAATGTVTASMKSNVQTTKTLSNTTEAAFGLDTGGIAHEMVVGLQVSKEKATQRSYSGLNSEDFGGITGTTCSGINLYNPDTSHCWVTGASLPLSVNPRVTEVVTKSLYATDTFKITPNLTGNLGLRIDDYDVSRSGTNTNSSTYAYSRQDTLATYNAGLTYKLNDSAMVYASVATSSNPSGQELDASGGSYAGLDASNQLFAPEKNTAIEVGTKWEVNHLSLTAAAFQTTKTNALETTGSGTSAVTAATGEYRLRGIELGVAGNVTDRLSVYGGAVWMESEVLASASSANIGKEIANISHEQFNLLGKYQVNDRLSLGGQATWTGSKNLGTMAANGNKLPSAWRFDAMAEYEINAKTMLSARIDNLLDQTYYDAAYRSGSPFVYVAPGRSAQITLTVKF